MRGVCLCARTQVNAIPPTPSSGLVAALSLIPNDPAGRMLDAGQGQDAGLETKRGVTSSKALPALGTKGKRARATRWPQHGQFPDWALRGGAGVGGPWLRDLGRGGAGAERGVDAAAAVTPQP